MDLRILRKQLDEERALLNEREKALALIEEWERELNNGISGGAPLKSLAQLSALSGAAIDDEIPYKRNTFEDNVREAIKGWKHEFAIPDIERAMASRGVEIPNKVRQRIAMVMKDLEDNEEVKRTLKGSGSEPHRFTLLPGFGL